MKRLLAFGLVGMMAVSPVLSNVTEVQAEELYVPIRQVFVPYGYDESTFDITEYENRETVERSGYPQATQEEYDFMLENSPNQILTPALFQLEDGTVIEVDTFLNEEGVMVSYEHEITPTEEQLEALSHVNEPDEKGVNPPTAMAPSYPSTGNWNGTTTSSYSNYIYTKGTSVQGSATTPFSVTVYGSDGASLGTYNAYNKGGYYSVNITPSGGSYYLRFNHTGTGSASGSSYYIA